ncbi:MAG: 5-formyltetrahydrofolate cyclo-ligase [Clostridia bacterium]|nr:5-formyltetrahydrofolate cyclo-ligase [Clostridia bacterium]
MNDKEELRYKLKIKRKYFGGVRREFADGAILDNFLNAFSQYESFFIYNSFSTEADTKALIAELVAAGKKVYLPRVDGEKMVAVPYGETVKGAFGIDEPRGKPYNGKIDVTVIPLLAVNGRGYRIGYGKGFYDRYLKDKRTKKVGLGYSFQIESFEEDKWDIPLDLFLCEKGIYYYESQQ